MQTVGANEVSWWLGCDAISQFPVIWLEVRGSRPCFMLSEALCSLSLSTRWQRYCTTWASEQWELHVCRYAVCFTVMHVGMKIFFILITYNLFTLQRCWIMPFRDLNIYCTFVQFKCRSHFLSSDCKEKTLGMWFEILNLIQLFCQEGMWKRRQWRKKYRIEEKIYERLNKFLNYFLM